MRKQKNKLKVFISSKTGETLADQKYVLARIAAKETLESTGLFEVYSFESEGPSTSSALNHYTWGLKESDICVFLIDNKDGVPLGVQVEIDTVKKYKIPSLYYFCQSDEKKKTQTQIDLQQSTQPKFSIINSFSEFIENCATHLLSDVLLTYKQMNKQINETSNIMDETFASTREALNSESKSAAQSEKINTNPSLLLDKERLSNAVCRNYFSYLLFGTKQKNFEEKDFDYYCSKFLSIIFENESIESFNMTLFLDNLKLQLPDAYYKVVEKRWLSHQKYLLKQYDESLKLLKEAFDMAKSLNGEIAEWLIQDILIDLRNRENSIAETKNEYIFESASQKELENRLEELYYPLIDRKEKNLMEWIEKERQKNEMRSYSSWSSYGNLSFLSNLIADIYYQAMLFGSFTHVTRIYSLIQKLSYQLSKFTDYWPSVMLLLKTTIVTLDYKKVTQITRNFAEMMEKMNEEDAKDVYEFSNNAKLTQNQFKANLISMSEIGYYLSDADFIQYWNSLKSKIRSWVIEENSMVSLQSYIFRCIKRINGRIEDDYIVDFGLSILDSSKKRYYDDVLKLLSENYVDYRLVNVDNSNKLIQVLINHLTNNTDFNEIKRVQSIFVLLKNESYEMRQEMEAFIQKEWPEFYLTEYTFEKYEDKESSQSLIESRIEEIKNRNIHQGKNGIYHGYTNDPYVQTETILKESDGMIKTEVIDELFIATANSIITNNQLVEDKLKAYCLAIFLTRFDTNIIERNKVIVDRIINYEDYESAQESMISYTDSTTLVFAHFVLLECLGKKKFNGILDVISTFNEAGRQIEGCKIINRFLYNYKKLPVKQNLESLFMQCSLLWVNSDDIDVRWYNIQILIKLMERKKYRKIISQNLVGVMNRDNAIVKSQIAHKIDFITDMDAEVGRTIYEIAKNDNNFAIRKIAANKGHHFMK
ncbi:hypothetical protein R0K17_11950 [Planococcus sp. SIMBA_143]